MDGHNEGAVAAGVREECIAGRRDMVELVDC